MLLTRKAWYGLTAVKHLAEQPRESSFSAKDLADLYGFPQEALAKILQRLARAGLLLSHHGIKGEYTLARDPHQISVLDVIKASEAAPHQGTSLQPHRQLRCSALLKLARRSAAGLLLTYTRGLVAVKSNLALFETGRRPSFLSSCF